MTTIAAAEAAVANKDATNRGMQSSYLPKETSPSAISFEDVAKYPGRACVGRMGAPSIPGFSPDGSSVVFLKSASGSLTQQLWTLDITTGSISELAKPPDGIGEEGTLSLEEKLRRERSRQLHTGITSFAWAGAAKEASLLCPVGNDLFVMQGMGNPLTKLFDSAANLPGPVLDPRISNDGSLVAFCCEKELYVCDLSAYDGTTAIEPKQITNSARGTALTNGLADFIAMEEMDRMEGFWISPSKGAFIAFEQSDESHIDPFRIMHLGQADPSTREEHHYPFAGAHNPKVRLGIVKVATTQIRWLGIVTPFGEDLYLARVQWGPSNVDGTNTLYVQVMNRKQSELVLLQFEVSAMSHSEADAPLVGKEILRESQPTAWINLHDMLVPLKGYGGGFIWASERTGFRHLYRYDAKSNLVAVLTYGEWMVENTSPAMVDEVGGVVYFIGTKDGPTECHLYCTSLIGGGEVRRVTPESGMHSILAMDFQKKSFIQSWSSLADPFRVSVCSLSDGLSVRNLYNGADDEKVKMLQLQPPELFSILADDGTTPLHGAIYKPDDINSGPWPALVSVYGGPHVQLVTNSWGLTADLRAQRLRSQGYVVIKLDNRGSARRGLEFELPIRHDMGNIEVRDQVSAVEHWSERGLVKIESVGIYGWSYGGYMAAMCLAKRSDIFKVAVAGAMVSSWDGYDTCYTERYMGTPQSNPEGYKRSAVMPHVDRIEGSLLIVHGLIDENVHFRHSARLINALIKAQKHYELLIFPDERHVPRGVEDKIFMEQRIASFFERCL